MAGDFSAFCQAQGLISTNIVGPTTVWKATGIARVEVVTPGSVFDLFADDGLDQDNFVWLTGLSNPAGGLFVGVDTNLQPTNALRITVSDLAGQAPAASYAFWFAILNIPQGSDPQAAA